MQPREQLQARQSAHRGIVSHPQHANDAVQNLAMTREGKGNTMDLKDRPIWLFPVIAAVVAFSGVFAILMIRDGATDRTSMASNPVRVSGEADVGGPFTLVNQDGQTVTQDDFAGRPMLIYFGFTYCPDICPFSLQVMDQALSLLPSEQAAVFQPVLISVDPERDTPEVLADYVRSDVFPDNLTGLTGTPDQIASVADAYRVYYARVDDESSSAGYTMDHTSIIYLMDSEGQFTDVFAHDATPQQIAARLQEFLQENRSSS